MERSSEAQIYPTRRTYLKELLKCIVNCLKWCLSSIFYLENPHRVETIKFCRRRSADKCEELLKLFQVIKFVSPCMWERFRVLLDKSNKSNSSGLLTSHSVVIKSINTDTVGVLLLNLVWR